jgi:hypothetical protein
MQNETCVVFKQFLLLIVDFHLPAFFQLNIPGFDFQFHIFPPSGFQAAMAAKNIRPYGRASTNPFF